MSVLPWIAFSLALGAGQPTATSRLGIPVGEKSRIHADLTTQFVYDSNVDRLDTRNNPSNLDPADGRFVLRPGLELDVPGKSFELNMRTAATVSHRFGFANSPEKTTGGFRASIKTRAGSDKAPVQFNLSDDLILTPVILSEPGTIGADEQAFPSWTNAGKAGVTFRPGGGALSLELAYRNQLQFFLNDRSSQPLTGSSRHAAFFETRYQFLPKTDLFFNTSFEAFVPETPEGETEDTLSASPLVLEAGASGKITPRISAELAVGYGNTLVYADGFFSDVASENNQSTVIGRARLGYTITRTANLSLGFSRSVDPLIRVKSANRNQVDLRSTVGIGRLVMNALVAYQYREFGEQSDAGEDLRSNVIIGDAGFRYYILEWLNFGARYRLLFQDTNEGDPVGGTPLLGNYTRHQVLVTLQAQY